jgi:hypothetical protein
MPTKEEIEAELNASEREKAIARLRELMRDWEEFEALIRAAEDKVWQPHWSYNDPLVVRLRRIGLDEETVRRAKEHLDKLALIVSGKALPAEIKAEAAELIAAEAAGLDLLNETIRKKR